MAKTYIYIVTLLMFLIFNSNAQLIQSNYPLPKNNLDEIYKKVKDLNLIKGFLEETGDFVKVEIVGNKIVVDKKPIIKKIKVKGNKSFWKNEIIGVSGIVEKHPLDYQNFKNVPLRVKQFYLDNGYFNTSVYVFISIDEKGQAVVKVKIDEGNQLELREIYFISDIPLSEKEKKEFKKFLKLKRGKPLKFQKLQDQIDKFSNFLKDKGYFDNFVTIQSIIPDGKKADLYLFLSLRKKYVIRFEGDFDRSLEKKLEELANFKTTGVSIFQIRTVAEKIETFFADNGYLDAKVKFNTKDEKYIKTIIFKINTGKLYFVKDIKVQSEDEKLAKKIEEKFENKPYKRAEIKEYLKSLENKYQKKGYLNARYTLNENINRKNKTVKLDIHFQIGSKFILSKIEVDGYNFKESIKVPTVYTGTEVLELLKKYKKILKDNGYFDSNVFLQIKLEQKGNVYYVTAIYKVDLKERFRNGYTFIYGVYHLNPKVIEKNLTKSKFFKKDDFDLDLLTLYSSYIFDYINPNLDIEYKDKIVNKALILHEEKRGYFQGSIGYDTDRQFKVYGSLTLKNLFSYGIEMLLFSEISSRGDSLFKYSIGDRLIPVRISGFASYFKSLEIHRLFNLNKKGYEISLEKVKTKHFKHSLVLEDTHNTVSNTSIPTKGRYKNTKINYIATFDYRKPKIDPKNGFYSTLKLQKGFDDTDFSKIEIFGRYYYPFKKFIFTQRFGFGYIFNSLSHIILPERYFIGGLSTVRGFGYEQIQGKNGEGGKSFILINTDFRYPLYKPLNLYGLIFIDLGNVYETDDDLNSLKFRKTAGIGVSVPTPVGSIMFDIATILDRKKDEGLYRLELSIGAMF